MPGILLCARNIMGLLPSEVCQPNEGMCDILLMPFCYKPGPQV